MDNIQTLIKERLEKLPPNIVEAIQSIPWIERMKSIGEAHKLSEDKMESFELETAMVVLGVEPPNNYPENLSTEVELDDETVISIAKEVDEQIIGPILKASENKTEEPHEVELPTTNLPMIEEGEVVHDVPHVEQATPTTTPEEKPKAPTPVTSNVHYDSGKDPYREPLV